MSLFETIITISGKKIRKKDICINALIQLAWYSRKCARRRSHISDFPYSEKRVWELKKSWKIEINIGKFRKILAHFIQGEVAYLNLVFFKLILKTFLLYYFEGSGIHVTKILKHHYFKFTSIQIELKF